MFQVDEHGHISPTQAPDLVFGIDHEVSYAFRPKNPYLACLPCHDVASEMADKTQCRGGTSASSLRGYMLLHVAGRGEGSGYSRNVLVSVVAYPFH